MCFTSYAIPLAKVSAEYLLKSRGCISFIFQAVIAILLSQFKEQGKNLELCSVSVSNFRPNRKQNENYYKY